MEDGCLLTCEPWSQCLLGRYRGRYAVDLDAAVAMPDGIVFNPLDNSFSLLLFPY
jgi:hypothetical protein